MTGKWAATGNSPSRLAEDPDFVQSDFAEMVSRLAHKVRNPLATIKSSAQLVKRLRMPPDAAQPYMESVVSEVTRIDRTIKELEEYAALRVGTLRPVEVAAVTGSAVADLHERADEAGVDVLVDGGKDRRVNADSRLLRTALTELIANAVQASSPGSTVIVRWEDRSDDLVAIHVDDAGAGIDITISNRFQRPFFSTSTQGVGLGLSIVLRICSLLGGWVEWMNRVEGGCRFSLILPGA